MLAAVEDKLRVRDEREAEMREREREREREKFIDNQIDDWRSVSTTPLQGDTAAGHSWPSISGVYPQFSVRPCGTRSATHKREGGDQTVAGLPQSPTPRPAL